MEYDLEWGKDCMIFLAALFLLQRFSSCFFLFSSFSFLFFIHLFSFYGSYFKQVTLGDEQSYESIKMKHNIKYIYTAAANSCL